MRASKWQQRADWSGKPYWTKLGGKAVIEHWDGHGWELTIGHPRGYFPTLWAAQEAGDNIIADAKANARAKALQAATA